MQRSSSLPGPGQAPHSHSPPLVQASVGNPDHPPPSRPLFVQPLESIQPPEPGSPYAHLLASRATQEVEGDGAGTKASGWSADSSSKPRSVSKAPYLSLLQDVSQYTNSHIKDATTEAASTTLEEFAHLVRLSMFQERKRSQSRLRLQRFLVSTTLSARLTRCGELAHRTLVENFRADDKKSFASLYNAIHDVRNSCDATRRFALLEPEIESGRSRPSAQGESAPLSTFMHEIPAHARETLLNFLSQVRTNPQYLASRICSLSSTELSAVSVFHQGLEPIDSVLPFHTRSKGYSSSSNRNSSHVPSAIERLLSFQRHDPLSTLIHTCFANSSGPGSPEDLRRTDVWATVCARLIAEGRSGAENFICGVINNWASMRDWSGKSNMEWFLMKILGDGAFLLEKAEDQAGTRIHVEPRNAKDSIAAEEFYDAAIKDLFEIIDDEGAGGIPEGVLELGNAILRKLDPRKHGATKRLLVTKWLFSIFLLNAVIHPESYGMMSEYHITEYGRQKILKEVAMKAQHLVVDLTWKQQGATPPHIRVHIESILNRFRTIPRSRSNPKLLPARSVTSMRETIEVRPYLVICPADLVTMVNALFPEKRPASSSLEKDMHLNGLRSTASSISGLSGISLAASAPPPSRGGVETASIISNSGSSIFSDSTSREPLLDDGSIATNRFSSTSISSMSQATRYEDEGYMLRLVIKEMSQALGIEATSGSCHPCAEQWAVLFIENDGQHLSTQMLNDEEDDADGEEEENSSSNDSEYDVDESKPELDKDYHQLRDSILKLVQYYEIPQDLDKNSESKAFSNRAFTFDSPGKETSLQKPSSRRFQKVSKNPYRQHTESPDSLDESPKSIMHQSSQESTASANVEDTEMKQSPGLLRMLEAAVQQCQAQSDFINAHLYWKTLQQLNQLSSLSLKANGYVSLLNIFSRGPRDTIRRCAIAIENYDAWLVWLKQSQERHDTTIEVMMRRLKALRDKMWYVTDVRNSAAYEAARSVASALRSMAAFKKDLISGVRTRNPSRTPTNNFLLKTEAQVMDIMAAATDQGGPNKLSDDQAERTSKWLGQFGIQNFCKGEERIHRFCLEVQTCINKLVGDSLMEGPVLWSSELFFRDKRILDRARQPGDMILTELGSLGIIGDNGSDSSYARRGLRNLDPNSVSRVGRDLRSMSARNTSQQSFDSGRWSASRASISGDIMDSQDYFGPGSPVLSIDAALTFWSPFQNKAKSPTPSMTSLRPGTASTANDTVMYSQSDGLQVPAKQEFLADLRNSLTAFLISDLGTLVFSRGSETDSWFSGKLGQECMERKERYDRRSRKKNKKRVIEKKRSLRDLRSAHRTDPRMGEMVEKAQNPSTKFKKDYSQHDTNAMADSSSASDTLSNHSNRGGTSRESPNVDFPYKAAFHKLLNMFSVHPDPYAKLNALYELEQLIIASLTTMPRRVRHGHLPLAFQSSLYVGESLAHDTTTGITTVQAKNLDEAIDNCNKRRSQIIHLNDYTPQNRTAGDARSINASTSTSTDMIVEVMQDLFRDTSTRPKTLFRDLQFIAAFVPASILDKTERGKAFWDTGLAALGLKQDVCRTMIEVADEIVVHYTQTRQTATASAAHAQTHSSASSSSSPSSDIKRYSMQDAAKMWTITAKEGDAVAERELAIFYLTHPELVERVTLPLSRPRDTFKAQVMEMHASSGESDRERNDPATMCVAYHWMELSATGGDELAKKYLRQREELNALP